MIFWTWRSALIEPRGLVSRGFPLQCTYVCTQAGSPAVHVGVWALVNTWSAGCSLWSLLACTNDQRYNTLNQYVCRQEVSFLFLGQSVITWSSHSIEHTSSCFVLITDTPYMLPYPHLHFIPLPQRYLSAPTVISKGHGPAHCHIHPVSSFMSSPLSTPAVISVWLNVWMHACWERGPGICPLLQSRWETCSVDGSIVYVEHKAEHWAIQTL